LNTFVFHLFILPYSVGQLALDSLSTRLGVALSQDRLKGGYFGETKIDVNGKPLDIALYKTRTLFVVVVQYDSNPAYHNLDAAMNISGPPVSMVLQKTVRAPTSLIVLHDSIENKPTTVTFKFGGSANGHNGVRSLIAALGTKDFFRLRLGVGRPKHNVGDYVLARLPNFERQFWAADGPGLDLVWDQILKIAQNVE
jgi:PTH1 family peptidyl-tRNA hydrolase